MTFCHVPATPIGVPETVKRDLIDLAVLGGRPEFTEPVLVGRPSVGDRARFLERADRALVRRRLSNGGPMVREFEHRVAGRAGVRHCVATCNATLALQLVARAAGLRDDVVMPAMTFPATPHALSWIGIRPVFCDVDPVTGNLTAGTVRAALTPRTSGIVAVHLWGRPCAVPELEELAARRGIPLLVDAAHAFGVSRRGRPVGGSGAAEVFSFHATKVVTTFEGGAVVTDDGELAARVRAMASFGMDSSGQVRGPGINAKMSEAAAAMGLTSLEAFDVTVAGNLANYRTYARELAGLPGIRLMRHDEDERGNFQYVVIAVEGGAGLDRDTLATVLAAENVVTRAYFSPGCHRLPPYDGPGTPSLPHTDRLAGQVLALPTGPDVGVHDVRRICAVIRLAVAHAAALTTRPVVAPAG